MISKIDIPIIAIFFYKLNYKQGIHYELNQCPNTTIHIILH